MDLEVQGRVESLFIDGEPATIADGSVKVLPDGSVSISNPDVEPMPIHGQPREDVNPTDGIVIGELFPPQLDPAIEGQVFGASSGSVGPSVGPVVVSATDLPDAPPLEPGVVRVVPIGSFLNDVQID